MPEATERTVLTVAELNHQIRHTLAERFASVWVAGEISDLSRPRSGHLYFSLKDPSGTIKAIVWRSNAARLTFEPEDGMQVVCRGEIDVYPPRGTYQLVARSMRLEGEGELQTRLRQRKDKLAAEGLFDPARKRPLPRFPQTIAVVTSPSGAALRDFVEVAVRRWPHTRILVVPSDVQGPKAAPQIAHAIDRVGHISGVDALLVTRGGGSLEDLWAFNEECVVRAIARAPIPVVSAVGHEIDVTLSDLVADVRALTPTEAGERMVPDETELRGQLRHYQQRLRQAVQARVQQSRRALESLAGRRPLVQPQQIIEDRHQALFELNRRRLQAMKLYRERARRRLGEGASKLQALSPLGVLARGYAVAQTAQGTLLRSTRGLQPDQEVHIRLAEGQFLASVLSIQSEKEEHHGKTHQA